MERDDAAILTQRLKGATLKDLAEANDMSVEGVRLLVAREGRRQIDEIELALLANTKTDDVLAFLIPDHGGPDFDDAMAYIQWVVAELTARDIKVACHYRPTHNGVCLALQDMTKRPRRRA